MRTIETQVYHFDELSETAKEKAREWYRQSDVEWENESEYILEDCKDIAKILGIDIDKIYYSGFWSQGDGACFIGSYRYKKGSAKAIRADMPNNVEIHRIADELANAQKRYFYRISVEVTHSFRYYHSHSVDFSIDSGNGYYYQDVNEETEEQIKDALRDFMDWIYKRLEEGYNHSQSDEVVDEGILANQYEFDEDGDRI